MRLFDLCVRCVLVDTQNVIVFGVIRFGWSARHAAHVAEASWEPATTEKAPTEHGCKRLP